jgi:hypothetical protein
MTDDPVRIRGIDEPLPEGERLLWQGAPEWRALARRAFHVRKVAIYFALLIGWRIASGVADGEPAGAIATAALWFTTVALAGIGVLAALAWASARTSTYAITTQRVFLRIGVALPMTVNLPLRLLDGAAMRAYPDGTGDIPLALRGDDRIAWLHLWPHVRPWRLARTQPMLRTVPEAARVARILVDATAAVAAVAPAPAPSERPAATARPPLAGAMS